MDIREFLFKKGPCLSSTIKNELIKDGLKDEAARQQISRARGGIYRLHEIQFPKHEYFIYLKDQFKSPLFYTNLVKAFKTTSSIHKCIITGIINFGGCVTIEKLKVLSGCPKSRKKKKTYDQVIRELHAVGLIVINDNLCFLQEDAFLSPKIYTDSKLISYLNDLFQEILAIWIKKNSMASYNAISYYGDFCSYHWDLASPSYLLPLINRKGEKNNPGFIVADIIPQFDINDDDVDYFIRKVESCFSERNTVPFIPILLGFKFKDSTWELLKKRNILAATVYNFFGEEIEKLLINIIELLKVNNISELSNFDNFNKVLKAISKIEGPTNNLKGVFFEVLVGYIASKIFPDTVTLNKKIHNDNISAEIDVLVTTSSEIIVYECKAKKSKQLITGKDIEKWINKIASLYSYFKSNNNENSNRKISFYFWTTSDFDDEANKLFSKMNVGKYKVEKKNGNEILAFTKNKNLEEICGILKQYFLNE
jgi:hypothetical protein